MKVRSTSIEGVCVVETTSYTDSRGAFSRLFCVDELAGIMGSRRIVQINRSQTHSVGAVRGLHYQRSPFAEAKFVTCLRGAVWDVAVDLRAGSRTFLKWHAEELRAGSSSMMVVPEGCAHGFQVLETDSELLYLHTAPYTVAAEGGVNAKDALLNIEWPLTITDISSRDQSHPLISPDFKGLSL